MISGLSFLTLLFEQSHHLFHLFLKDTQFRQLPMQNFVISPDGRILRWTCTLCQQDNLFAANSFLYLERVKWRCEGCRTTAVVYRPDEWIKEAMSECMEIQREGQRAKWHSSNGGLTDTNPTDSINRNDIDICASLLAERRNLTSRRDVVHEKPNQAARTFNLHVKNSVFLLEKSGIDA
jgi:hypothetical protein